MPQKKGQPEKEPHDSPKKILDSIDSPKDLKSLSITQLEVLAQEIRSEIIQTISRNGGHFGSPLGVVEITLALHYVFDMEKDDLIWDVGHQSYAHKIVTGRKDQFHALRKKGGIGGYPRRDESPYDTFGTGHSSTSISAALGMAVASDRLGDDHSTIAVIGDGAMTAGMAFEALTNAGGLAQKNLIIVLNDNQMSISKSVTALSSYFSRLLTTGVYNRAKEDIESFIKRALGKRVTNVTRRIEHSVRNFLGPGVIFDELGLHYVGPVDGNDLHTLIEVFSNLRNLRRPVLMHCVTQKGKGYGYAEKDALKWHGVKPFNIDTGVTESEALPSEAERKEPPAKTFTDAFADALIEAAHEDDRLIAITAAMPTGTGLNKFEKAFPDRFFDVGICEQHAITFAAGMAVRGLRPIVAIYSTFLQRGYDQFVHDVCIQNLPVIFAIDRAGLVGEDSPTQQGTYDLSFLRAIPNITLMAPRDDIDTALLLKWALQQDHPIALRYARSKAPTIGNPINRDITRGEILRSGADATFLALGPVISNCIKAAEALQDQGYSIGVADARFIKPLDTQLLETLAQAPIITVEENTLQGGFGAAVMEHFEQHGRLEDIRIKRLGLPDRFLDHATRDEQLQECALHPQGLIEAAQAFLGARVSQIAK